MNSAGCFIPAVEEDSQHIPVAHVRHNISASGADIITMKHMTNRSLSSRALAGITAVTIGAGACFAPTAATAQAANETTGSSCTVNGSSYTNPAAWVTPIVSILSIYTLIPEDIRESVGLPVSQNVRDAIGTIAPNMNENTINTVFSKVNLDIAVIVPFVIAGLALTQPFYTNCVTDVVTVDKSPFAPVSPTFDTSS